MQKLPPIPSKQVEKYLNKLNDKTRERVKKAICEIPKGDIVPYEGNKEYLRLRVGKFRILFKWISDEQINVALIDSRGQIYKRGV
jgi:mRNA interferase RelE/StbE